MQQELTDLQPQLIKTSAETETLMEKIEIDTVEVEAKKEVCTEPLTAEIVGRHWKIINITKFKCQHVDSIPASGVV